MRLFVSLPRTETEDRLLATGRYTRADRALRTDQLWISVRRNTAEANGPAYANWPTTIEVDLLDALDDPRPPLARLITDLAPAEVVEAAR
jgi:hypothetical protein